MDKLTNQDINNLLSLINIAPIKGNEAMTVAVLQQKLNAMLVPDSAPITPAPEKKEYI